LIDCKLLHRREEIVVEKWIEKSPMGCLPLLNHAHGVDDSPMPTSLLWPSENCSSLLSRVISSRQRSYSWCCALWCRNFTAEALRYSTRCRRISVLPAHPCVCPRIEWTIPAFAFPAEASPPLPTLEGWKTELAQAPPRWVNSLPEAAAWQLPQLLAAQTVTPH